MSSTHPLFKSYTLPDDTVLTMIGGSAKIQKPLYTNYQNRGPKILIAKRPNPVSSNDYGKVTVGFSADYDDTFGTEISHVYTNVLNNTQISVLSQAEDAFSINTNETGIEFRVLNVQLIPTQVYDLSNPETVNSLLAVSTIVGPVTRISSIATPTDLSISNNINDPNSVKNKSPQLRDFGSAYKTKFELQNYVLSKYTVRDENGDIQMNDENVPLSSNVYGPMTYDVMVFVKDINNSSSNQFSTTSLMRRYVDIHGLDNVQLIIPNGETIANSNDTLNITWNFSNANESLSNFGFIKIFKNTVPQTAIDGLSFSSITKNGTTYTVSVSNLSAIEAIGYRGEIKAYVQWKNVDWSPLNVSSPIIFSYSSEPLSNFIIYVSSDNLVHPGLLDTELYFRLQPNTYNNNYFATNVNHTVTFMFYENDPNRNSGSLKTSVTYTDINNTNITEFGPYIIGDLEQNTRYFVSYTISDGRNSYTGIINNPDPDPSLQGGYKTRYDDIVSPTISNFRLIPMETEVRVLATISDNIALQSIEIIAIEGNHTTKTNEELATYFNVTDQGTKLIENVQGVLSKNIDTIISVEYDNGRLLANKEYTIVIRALDHIRNTTFSKTIITTDPDIEITDVIFESLYKSYNVSANLEFSVIDDVNIDYYIGVFTANVDSTNEVNVLSVLLNNDNNQYLLLGQNVDASNKVNVQGTLSSAFNVNGTRTDIDNGRQYNLVIFARGHSSDFSFIKDLAQTRLQIKQDTTSPIIHNINVVFNVI